MRTVKINEWKWFIADVLVAMIYVVTVVGYVYQHWLPGQTFMVAGLLDKRETQQLQKMPVIGDIPILGNLFKSRKDNKANTELVMFVTPEVVRAQPAGTPMPEFKFPNEYLDLVNPDATKRN